MNKHLKNLEGMGNQFSGTGIQWQNPAPDASPVRSTEASHTMSTGIRQAFAEPPEADDLMTEALAEDILAASDAADDVSFAQPSLTGLDKDRGIFERSIAARRAEKAKQQQIIASARAKCRQLTESIHAMEASLDLLLEVA